MKARHLIVIALAALAGAVHAQAHDVDPGGTIEVACDSNTVGMAAIKRAVEASNYWAPQTARRRMLSLAQQACMRGATRVSFVPPADQRLCRATPAWSTLCVDEQVGARRGADPSTLAAASARQ